MKNEHRMQARDLFLRGGYTKTEIGDILNVSRRTIYQWSLEGNWDNLKKSAQHMPAIMAEKCYYILGHLTDNILHRESLYETVTKDEVNMLHKLAITVSKLKEGSTVNENMQTFNLLLDRVNKEDPSLATQLIPHVDRYVSDRRNVHEASFLLDGFNNYGYKEVPEKEMQEKWQDEKDFADLQEEMLTANRDTPPPSEPLQPVANEKEPPLTPSPAAELVAVPEENVTANGNPLPASPLSHPAHISPAGSEQHPQPNASEPAGKTATQYVYNVAPTYTRVPQAA